MNIPTLGGYRVVRKLGEGARAEVFLGYPQRDESTAPAAALKVYRPGVGHDTVIAEVEALSRAAGDHVVRVLDVCTAPDGTPAVMLERLMGDSLARLLLRRPRLRLGEAVTILAPIATTVARLHTAGVAHGAVRAESILFTEAGAPVLACFGAATLVAPGMPRASLEASPAVAADAAGVTTLAEVVLERVDDPAASRLAAWAVSSPNRVLAELAAVLFEHAEAEAIDFAEQPAAALLPPRIVTADPVSAVPVTRAALALPEWVQRYLPAVRSVRPRLWVTAGAVAAALVAAALFVPTGGSDAAPEPSPSRSAESALVGDARLVGDDPVPAALALLEARERCIRDLSLLCLDAVDQPDSAALAHDQEVVRALQSGGESPDAWSIAEVTVTERLGGSAILAVVEPGESEPASVLLVKGEAGWRIRNYVWR